MDDIAIEFQVGVPILGFSTQIFPNELAFLVLISYIPIVRVELVNVPPIVIFPLHCVIAYTGDFKLNNNDHEASLMLLLYIEMSPAFPPTYTLLLILLYITTFT